MFEIEELTRYSRQLILPELGLRGQQKLKLAKVLVVGAGGLGCPILQYLAAAGVGTIGIIDDDTVAESNLHRQILYSPLELGSNKASTAKAKLQVFNPHISIVAHPVRLTEQNVYTLFENYELIIDGSDNFPTRYLVNDACVALDKPLIFGSIYQFEGQVSVFNYQTGPDYRDLFPEPPPDGEVPNCTEIGVIGVLPGMVGTFMANEAIKIICGLGETLSGRLLIIDALKGSIKLHRFCETIPAKTNATLSTTHREPTQDAASQKHEITMIELTSLLDSTPDEICLVDVREMHEFEDYNMGGINIPLYELGERLSEIPKGKSKIIFCCQTGQRSEQAVLLIKPLVEAEVFNLKGGIYNAPF